MTTASATNVSQIAQFITSAIVRHGSAAGKSCRIVTGIVSTAATNSGRSKQAEGPMRRAIPYVTPRLERSRLRTTASSPKVRAT